MNYRVTIPATTSLVTVDDLKTHLLLFGDNSYDTELQAILLAAEGFVADFLGEYLVATTVRVNIASFGDLALPHKNPSSIVVSYWDSNNVAQTLSESEYTVDVSGDYPRIIFDNQPTGLSNSFAYKGYVTYSTVIDPIPNKLKHAVLLVAAELFENRHESKEKTSNLVTLSSRRLIQSSRGW